MDTNGVTKINCGVLLIATRKYKQFVPPLLEQIDKLFLPKEEVTIFLFTDENFVYKESDYDFVVKQFQIESLKFPFATLLRYRLFSQQEKELKQCSHLYYLDVDMGIIENVGEEILGEGLTAVIHPGFFNGGGSWETRPESKTYVPLEKRKKYYAGGFQGGSSVAYLEAAKTMAAWIDEDEKNGILPIWHDESAWNKYLSEEKSFIELDSGYCMVQQNYLREQWGISHLTPRIIALAKDHKSIRE